MKSQDRALNPETPLHSPNHNIRQSTQKHSTTAATVHQNKSTHQTFCHNTVYTGPTILTTQ